MGAAKLINRLAEFALTPLDVATTSDTAADLLPKIRPKSCCPSPCIFEVVFPPENKAAGLLTAASYPPSRTMLARPVTPSEEDVILVIPPKMLGTALNNACRVADSGSPTVELA
jgi:hypothetical protein